MVIYLDAYYKTYTNHFLIIQFPFKMIAALKLYQQSKWNVVLSVNIHLEKLNIKRSSTCINVKLLLNWEHVLLFLLSRLFETCIKERVKNKYNIRIAWNWFCIWQFNGLVKCLYAGLTIIHIGYSMSMNRGNLVFLINSSMLSLRSNCLLIYYL